MKHMLRYKLTSEVEERHQLGADNVEVGSTADGRAVALNFDHMQWVIGENEEDVHHEDCVLCETHINWDKLDYFTIVKD